MNRPVRRQWEELLAMQQRLAHLVAEWEAALSAVCDESVRRQHVEAERDALRAENERYKAALERIADDGSLSVGYDAKRIAHAALHRSEEP